MNKHKLMRWGTIIVLVVLIIWAGIYARSSLDFQHLKDLLASYGIWAPLVFMGIYIAATILFLPGAALTIVGGLLFGPVLGTLYNIVAAVIGSTASFLIARYVASDWVKAKAGGRLKQLLEGVEKEGWKFVAFVRLVPVFPFNLLNYALGLTKINVGAYIVASAIFMLPGTFAYTYVGSLGETFIEGGGKEIATRVLIAIGLLVALAAIPYMVRKFRRGK